MGDFPEQNKIGVRKEPSTVFHPETNKRPGPSTLTLVSLFEASMIAFFMLLHGGQEPH